MSSLMIGDLDSTRDLDHHAMSTVRGGTGQAAGAGNDWLKGLGSIANVNVGVNQNITQLQQVDVNALNNVGVIGAAFGPLNLNVNPSQWANANIAF